MSGNGTWLCPLGQDYQYPQGYPGHFCTFESANSATALRCTLVKCWCTLWSQVPGCWGAYSKHLPVPDRDPAPLKIGPFFFTLAPLLTEGPSGKRKLVWTRNQNIHNHVNTWIHRKYLHPCEHVNTQTIITFRQDGKMSKMHRRRRSRDGLSHMSLFLLFQQFDGRVGELADTGHGAAAEPVWEGQLATMGWPGHPYRQTDAQVVSFTLKIFGR